MTSHLVSPSSSPCRRLVALAAAAVILLVAAPVASARRGGMLTGTLSKPGFTVVALGYNGKAATSSSRRFRIKAPDTRVTLQLVSGSGKYAGPVIVRRQGSRVIEGVKAGARLGTIKVRSGYATTVRPLAARFVDRARWAQAQRGVPLGNGRNFGLVRSSIHSGPAGPGGDTSRTGVPNILSIDPAGDGVIAALRPAAQLHGVLAPVSRSGARAVAAGDGPAPAFSFFSQIFLGLDQTLNADASGVSTADIDAMLPQHLNIVGVNVPDADSVALDCGGLRYCSPGGTGQITTDRSPDPGFAPFPSCCDPNGDGFGVLRGPGEVGLGGDGQTNNWAFFYPRASSAQIGSGDAFVLRVTSGGTLTETPVTLGFVFDTVPALSAWADSAGDSGAITYPAGPSDAGTQTNPIPVAAGPDGEVSLELTFWRPQRAGIAGAGEAAFMDIGHLQYYIDPTNLAQNADALANAGTPGGPPAGGHRVTSTCSAASLSTTDPNLSASASDSAIGQVVDGSADAPADPAHTLSLTVDLTRCLSDGGVSGFPVGAQGAIGLAARAPSSGDHAVQNIWIRRVR